MRPYHRDCTGSHKMNVHSVPWWVHWFPNVQTGSISNQSVMTFPQAEGIHMFITRYSSSRSLTGVWDSASWSASTSCCCSLWCGYGKWLSFYGNCFKLILHHFCATCWPWRIFSNMGSLWTDQGSPLSPVIADFSMEKFEQTALQSTPCHT